VGQGVGPGSKGGGVRRLVFCVAVHGAFGVEAVAFGAKIKIFRTAIFGLKDRGFQRRNV
jgi:hypothetical protein